MSKFGSFEWIVDYESLKPYIDQAMLSLSNSINFSSCKKSKRVIDIGCGTSSLFKDLAKDGYELVDGLDNDSECIDFLRQEYSNKSNSLCNRSTQWYHYDLVDQTGSDSEFFRNCKGQYDLIIDKGTFDAILVEGSVSPMLVEVIRLLNENDGIYILCSINTIELLQRLFTLPILELDCTFYELPCLTPVPLTNTCLSNNSNNNNNNKTSTFRGNIVIAKKCRTSTSSTFSASSICLDTLLMEEEKIMTEYFQLNHPLLTLDMEDRIRKKLDSMSMSSSLTQTNTRTSNDKEKDNKDHQTFFSISDIYTNIIIGILEMSDLDYPYDLFLEDVESFVIDDKKSSSSTLTVTSALTADDIIEFIKVKQ